MGYWALEEASGTIYDATTNNCDSTGQSVTYGSTGILNDCLSFNGSSNYVRFGNVCQPTSALSISVWVKCGAFAEEKWVVENAGYDTGYCGYRLTISTANGWTYMLSNNDNMLDQYVSFANMHDNNWHHLCFTWAGGTTYYYTDGSKTAGGSWANTLIYTSPTGLGFGQNDLFGGNFYSGLIDEVGIWSRALTDAEVAFLYNGGTGRSCYSVDTTPSPTPTMTPTLSISSSVVGTPSITPTRTPSLSISATPSLTPTRTPSLSISRTPSLSIAGGTTPSLSISATPSLTPTRTPSLSISRTPSLSIAGGTTPSLSISATPSLTPTRTPSLSISRTPSLSISRTPSLSISRTPSLTPTRTSSISPTTTPSLSISATPSLTPTRTPSLSIPQYTVTFYASTNSSIGATAIEVGYSTNGGGSYTSKNTTVSSACATPSNVYSFDVLAGTTVYFAIRSATPANVKFAAATSTCAVSYDYCGRSTPYSLAINAATSVYCNAQVSGSALVTC